MRNRAAVSSRSQPIPKPKRKRKRRRVDASYVDLAKFFDVLQHVIELFLENFRLVFCQIDPRQPCDVRYIEIRISSHIRRSRMQMADKPHDREP